MKKVLFVALAMVMASCAKESVNEATLVFNYGIGTKAAVGDAIEGLMPSKVRITLTAENGQEYQLYTGTSVTLPLGHYSVYGYTWPEDRIEFVKSEWTASEPYIVIDDDIDVAYNTSAVALSASLECFALAYSTNIVDKIEYHNGYTSNGTIAVCKTDTLGVTFIHTTNPSFALGIKVYPKQGLPYNMQEYQFGAEGFKVSDGKYYYMDLDEIKEVEPNVSLNYPDWEQGVLE